MTSLLLDSSPSPPALAVAIGAVATGLPEGAQCWSTVAQDTLAVRAGTWQQFGSGGVASGGLLAGGKANWLGNYVFNNAAPTYFSGVFSGGDITLTLPVPRQVRVEVSMFVSPPSLSAPSRLYVGFDINAVAQLENSQAWPFMVGAPYQEVRATIHKTLPAGTHVFRPGAFYWDGGVSSLNTTSGSPVSLYVIDEDPTSNGPLAQSNIDGGGARTSYAGVPIINGGSA